MQNKNKKIGQIAAAVGMCCVVAAGVAVTSVLPRRSAASLVEDTSSSVAADSVTMDEPETDSEDVWSKLLAQIDEEYAYDTGTMLDDSSSEETAASEEASSETVEEAALSASTSSSSSSSVTSSSKAESHATASVAASSNTMASSAHSSSTSSSVSNEKSECDKKLAQYVRQMEKLQKKSQSQLYSVICEAYDEYMAHPESERSFGMKISIVLSKGGKLNSLQSECDKEFNTLLAEMRQLLKENGRDQTLADEAEKAYKDAKSAMIKELTDIAYSTAVGEGVGGKWIETHRNMA